MKKPKIIIICLISLIAVLLVTGFFVARKLLTFEPDDGVVEEVEDEEPDDYIVEQLDAEQDESSLSALLKSWATCSEKSNLMRDKDVYSILLVGADKAAENSDVMMLCSINTETSKIYLTSVMRDCFTYIKKSDGSDSYAKLNAAYANGGIATLKETFQNNFKIKIDHYAKVDFSSFAEIVDIMGGINMTVEQYEAAEIDKVIKRENKKTSYDPCPYGEDVLLEGIYALTYCRIRYCYNDADVHRTLNQRKFISTLIEKSKTVSIGQAKKILTTMLGYIKTDMSATDIMSFATKAILNKWYNYEVVSNCYPEETERLGYSGYAWVWIVDYPASAQKMQNLIYGKTNITLSEDRITAIDIINNGWDKGDAHP